MKVPRNKVNIMILAFLCVANIIFIFSNSIPSIPESKKTSEQIMEIVDPVLSNYVEDSDTRHHMVRKSAHVIEFFTLGILLTALLHTLKQSVFWGCSIGIFVALIDETVQIFTNRGAQLQDVWLDFGSLLAAVVITSVISRAICYNASKAPKV